MTQEQLREIASTFTEQFKGSNVSVAAQFHTADTDEVLALTMCHGGITTTDDKLGECRSLAVCAVMEAAGQFFNWYAPKKDWYAFCEDVLNICRQTLESRLQQATDLTTMPVED